MTVVFLGYTLFIWLPLLPRAVERTIKIQINLPPVPNTLRSSKSLTVTCSLVCMLTEKYIKKKTRKLSCELMHAPDKWGIQNVSFVTIFTCSIQTDRPEQTV